MLGVLAAAVTALTVGLIGTAWLIRVLRRLGIGQPIHEAVTQHIQKAGTPTMGGLALAIAAPLGYGAGLLALGRAPSPSGIMLLVAIVAGGTVGAVDDWLKVTRGRNTLGLRERQKTILLLGVAVLFVGFTLQQGATCHAPSLARCELPNLGPWGWSLWVVAVVWLTTNSVNFADGLDGLLAGSAIPPMGLLSALAFWQFRHPELYGSRDPLDIALVMAAMTAAGAGLLWWSAPPAAVFMGETGSLAIGSGIVIAALSLHIELLIPVFGALFFAQGASSFLQRSWYKLTRRFSRDHRPRRLFRMAPLHHHFELLGWPEPTIVFRFWILSGLASAAAAAIFYADALAALG